MQREKWKTMDVILVILAIFLLVFVIVMIAIYIRTGGIPDQVIRNAFFIRHAGNAFRISQTGIHRHMQLEFHCRAAGNRLLYAQRQSSGRRNVEVGKLRYTPPIKL